MECLTDIRDGHGAVINRTRGSYILPQNGLLTFLLMHCCALDVINALTFSPFTGGPINDGS